MLSKPQGTGLVVFASFLLLAVPYAHAKKGTVRAASVITDNRPVFDCTSEDYANAGVLLDCTGTVESHTQLQSCIDAASAVEGVAYMGECDILIDTSIELNDPVTLMGCGGNSAWANADLDGTKACTRLILDDAMTTPGIYVRGDPTNGKGYVAASGDTGAQGITIQGFKIISETTYNAEGGIKLDGTYADEEACQYDADCVGSTDPYACCTGSGTGTCDNACSDGCDRGTDCKGPVRDISIIDVGCYEIDGYCFDGVGNVFDIYMDKVFSYKNGDTGLILRDLGAATCNNTACVPKQITVKNGVFKSCSRQESECNASTWAYNGGWTYFEGGHIQGDYGAFLTYNNTIIGTHIEHDITNPTSGNVGVQIANRNNTIVTDEIAAWDFCLVIGEDGSANQTDNYFVNVGNLTNCADTALVVEDGGDREGIVNVGSFVSNTADIDNQRTGTANQGEVLIDIPGVGLRASASGLTMSDVFTNLPTTSMALGNGGTSFNVEVEFNIDKVPAQDPKFLWDVTNERFAADENSGASRNEDCTASEDPYGCCTGNGTGTCDGTFLAIGDGAAEDQGIVMVDDAGDHTIQYNTTDEVFDLSDPIRAGGTGSEVTASSSNDLALNVDDGQFVKPDTTVWKECADTAGAATVTADDCNMITFTGSTSITTLNTCNAANTGRVLYISCGAYTGTITDGNNLDIAGDLECNTDADTLVLLCDGSNWLELSRSLNN